MQGSIFFMFLFCLFALLPLHNLSLEHTKLEKRHGKETGDKIGAILGKMSGWGFFAFLFCVWIAPQPSFNLVLGLTTWGVSFLYFDTSMINIIAAVPLVIASCWIGIGGVIGTSVETASNHKTEMVVTTDMYACIRHPQYLAALLAHLGFSILFSSLYSLLAFPLICGLVFVMSRKEEMELVVEFGDEYKEYMRRTSMFLPIKIKH